MTKNTKHKEEYPQQLRYIEKSLNRRISELLESLQVIKDALDGLRTGRNYQLIPLSGQLRALLTEKRRDNKPLLLDLAEIMDGELLVYAMPDTEKSDIPFKDDLLFHISGFPVSLRQELPAQQSITVEKFLEQKIVYYGGKYYSVKTIIWWFANIAGGAHFPPKLHEKVKDFIGLKQVLENPLFQIGVITFKAGVKFVKRLCDFEIHFLIAIRDLPKTEAYLFDAKYPKSDMRFSLLIDHLGKLKIRITDIQRQSIVLAVAELLDWTSVRHIKFCFKIADDLSTKLKLVFDGSIVATLQMPTPLFLSSNIRDYDVFINRATDGDVQEYKFGLVEMCMIGAEENSTNLARIDAYFDDKRQQKNLKCCVYTPKSYSSAMQGENDQSMYGKVQFLNVDEPTPKPPEVPEPIYEWQKFLDEYAYDFYRMDITEEVERIKSLNIDSEHVTSEKADIPEVEIETIARATQTEDWSTEELKKQLTKQIHSIARYALLEYDRNPDEREYLQRKNDQQKRKAYTTEKEPARERAVRLRA